MNEARPARLQGKVIMVTGAGTGLGHAAALRAAHEGARLALLDIDAAALERSRTTILAEVSPAGNRRPTEPESSSRADEHDS
jgi:NAD(P)-dependent dehydrogenase (short-subunit alcohol dehydrogenase family)